MTPEPSAGLVVPGVDALLRLLREAEPGRPRLTWYGSDGERVELSGRVLDNWVAKTANLLVDELDVGPGSRVLLHLPVHWRTATWLLAVWAAGGCAVLPPVGSGDGALDMDVDPSNIDPTYIDPMDVDPSYIDPTAVDPTAVGEVDVVVSDRPELVAGMVAAGAQLVAQPLPALAVRWAGALPPGALDATSEVRGQGDVFVPMSPASDDLPALDLPPGGVVSRGELFAAAAAVLDAAGRPTRPRVLIETGRAGESRLDPARWLLAALAADGSVVLVDRAVTGSAGPAPAASAPAPAPAGSSDVAAQEGVTARW